MKEKIEHEGIINSVSGEHVSVRIVQQAACNGCKAKSLCTSSESKEKLIDVYEINAEDKYKVGDNVKVCGALSMGKQAVMYAFGLPLAIIVVLMPVALKVFGLNELLSVALVSVILAVYFLILYFNRDKMAKRFAFWIE